MPRVYTYTYNGMDFIVSRSDGTYRDKRYHATLTYKQTHPVIKKRASSLTEEGLDRRLANRTAPALFAEVIDKLASQAAEGGEAAVSLPVFYAVWREDIHTRKGWEEGTIKRKEALLYEMFRHLPKDMPLACLSLADICKAAAMAVWGKESIDKAEKKYRNNYKETISFTSLILDRATMAGFFTENFLRPYNEILKSGSDKLAAIRKAFKNYYIEAETEAALYAHILAGFSKDGLLLGAAFMLFAGLHAKEACALRFGDIVQMTWRGQPLYVIRVGRQAPRKEDKDEDAMVPYSYRCIPMHRQLAPLFAQCRKSVEKRLESLQSRMKLENVYVVRSGMRLKGDTAPKTLHSYLTQLLKRMGVKPPPPIPVPENGNVVLSANYTKLLRYNFENRMIDAGMTADELNHLLGRAASSTDAKYYRDWASLYCMMNLKNKMDRWHVRTGQDRLPEPVICDDGVFVRDTGAVPAGLHAQLRASVDGTYNITVRSGHGLDLSAQIMGKGEDDGEV